MPIPVPHDDADNVAFIIFTGGKGLLMSLIWVKPPMRLKKHLKGCSHISIEQIMIIIGFSTALTDSLKRRISGRGGHLSNLQTANILREVVVTASTKSIVLCTFLRKTTPHT